MLFAVNWQGAHDEEFWNAGYVGDDGKPEYPVDKFWAERFLEYPNDRLSGPRLKAHTKVEKKPPPKTSDDDVKAKQVTTGLGSYYAPYGGGPKICPGRHFVKQEILACIAVITRAFGIELLDPKESMKAEPGMKVYMTGSMPPDRKNPSEAATEDTLTIELTTLAANMQISST
jgi:hypothetical protein